MREEAAGHIESNEVVAADITRVFHGACVPADVPGRPHGSAIRVDGPRTSEHCEVVVPLRVPPPRFGPDQSASVRAKRWEGVRPGQRASLAAPIVSDLPRLRRVQVPPRTRHDIILHIGISRLPLRPVIEHRPGAGSAWCVGAGIWTSAIGRVTSVVSRIRADRAWFRSGLRRRSRRLPKEWPGQG
jgi:hypothetical protein